MGSDTIALGISVLSAVFALVSLWIAVLSYRRGRPRVVVRDAGVVTAVSNGSEGHDRERDVAGLLVHALLVNRGQARVQLSPEPLMVEFQPSTKRRLRRSRRRKVGPGVFAPLAARAQCGNIGGFAGLEISGALPAELIARATTAWLWGMRLRITLSSGDVVVSRWFKTPEGTEVLRERRRAELRAEAIPAMRDLAQVIKESQGYMWRAGLRSEEAWELFQGKRTPTWPAIAKIVNSLEASGAHRLEFWKRRWTTSLTAAITDDELRDETQRDNKP